MRVGADPSALITKISVLLVPIRLDVAKAILVPSGDHVGWLSYEPTGVRFVRAEPSVRTA